MAQVTVNTLMKMKKDGEKIAALTAYDFPFGTLVDESGVHVILVGDSLGMVIQGEKNTLPVTMDHMIYHTRLVTRGVKQALVVGDMPFMSYQTGLDNAVQNAGRFLKEAGATAVKLEGGADVCPVIQAMTRAGIPVQAHIGLTPQSVHQMGGYKVQRDEDRLLEDAMRVQDAGAFSVILEGIPGDISQKITESLGIPTIGIGAGPHCDGQILVLHDMLGLNARYLPKFVKKYADLDTIVRGSIKEYVNEVSEGQFPGEEHCYK